MKWLGHVSRVKKEDSIKSLMNREIARRREKEVKMAEISTKRSREGLKTSRTQKWTTFILLSNLKIHQKYRYCPFPNKILPLNFYIHLLLNLESINRLYSYLSLLFIVFFYNPTVSNIKSKNYFFSSIFTSFGTTQICSKECPNTILFVAFIQKFFINFKLTNKIIIIWFRKYLFKYFIFNFKLKCKIN